MNEVNNKQKGYLNKSAGYKRAVFYDKAAKVVIYSGGIATIIAVIGILAFVFIESFPLWFSSSAEEKEKTNLTTLGIKIDPLLIGIDEYQQLGYIVTDSATVDFLDIENNVLTKKIHLNGITGKVTAASRTLSNNFIAVATENGAAGLYQIKFDISFDKENNRIIEPSLISILNFKADSLNNKISKIVFRVSYQDEYCTAFLTENNKIYFGFLNSINEEKNINIYSLSEIVKEKITAIELDDFCEKLMVGTSSGRLYYISVKEKDSPVLIQVVQTTKSEKVGITALQFINGDQSIIVGDEQGNLSSYMRINDTGSDYGWKLVQPHTFEKFNSAVTSIAASSRNKSFLAGDKDGKVRLFHLTSERTLVDVKITESGIENLVLSPKSDGAMILTENGIVTFYVLDNPHPEITLKTLFGKVWYEGYTKPEFVWQSTGGTDDFEPKLSLIPLILGTMKGTFYALIFAIPLALLGAVYTSQFAHPNIKNVIKPTVEIMAALPSVVIGFLAGLWLAPLLERILPGVFLMFIIFPLMAYLGVILWKYIPKLTNIKLKSGYEVFLIIPLLLIGVQLSLWLGPYFESIFLGGDYRSWISSVFNEQYDQRNSIVVGFAMGFAVIPIIFTICEDSLSSVPNHLTSASLALGATRWQTALRVVLPTASPGIFSAIMIGFGRAIGETMIVLMATGNTPILSFSPFNGMRTLSANIAVEIPEAPYQGTLYRVLFLAALLLFVMTFIVNTAAEIVRQRLRKKYMDI